MAIESFARFLSSFAIVSLASWSECFLDLLIANASPGLVL